MPTAYASQDDTPAIGQRAVFHASGGTSSFSFSLNQGSHHSFLALFFSLLQNCPRCLAVLFVATIYGNLLENLNNTYFLTHPARRSIYGGQHIHVRDANDAGSGAMGFAQHARHVTEEGRQINATIWTLSLPKYSRTCLLVSICRHSTLLKPHSGSQIP